MDATIILTMGSGLADMASETAETFGVNWPEFLAQVISFIILAIILHRFAFKPLLRVLDERRQRVAESLADAERIKTELAARQQERAQTIATAQAEAAQIVLQAKTVATSITEQERRKATLIAEQIVAKAHEDAQMAQVHMRNDLCKEIGELVILTTAKLGGRTLTPDDQQRLREETLKEATA